MQPYFYSVGISQINLKVIENVSNMSCAFVSNITPKMLVNHLAWSFKMLVSYLNSLSFKTQYYVHQRLYRYMYLYEHNIDNTSSDQGGSESCDLFIG